MAVTQERIALVAGASGLVGSLLTRLLCEAPEYTRVYALSRRPLAFEHPRLANRIIPFDRLEQQLRGLACHDAYCCLGTTLRAAGSEAAFRQVDFDYALAFARAARAAGAERFAMVSAAGADPGSERFYLRVKGEAEVAVGELGFRAVDIMQPSLLLGSRREFRPAELAARLLAPLVNPLLTGKRAVLRAIPARDVAQALLAAARQGRVGINRYTYPSLVALAVGRSAPRG